MTVVPSGGSTAVTPHTGIAGGIEGLEDVEAGDVILPRIQIDHKNAIFRDNLSKKEYNELDVIILGLIKQRIFWADDTDDGDKPLCKSPDFSHGFPNVRDDTPRDKQFPWQLSNFRPEDYPPGAANSINGLVTLPCDACIFKEWEKGNWKIPPCAEQHTFAVLYLSNPEDPVEDARWTSALITFQKTGIKPSKQYISSFVQAGQPMFTVNTKITLTPAKRGSVEYAVPSFRKMLTTDKDFWPNYGEQFRNIRDFVRQPPRSQDDDEDFTSAPASNENTAPQPAAAPTPPVPTVVQPQTPTPAAPPVAVTPAEAAPSAPADPNDDLPF